MTAMPTAEDLRFAADMMRANAEAWLTDESDGASDEDVKAYRAELAIAGFFLRHHGKPDAGGLVNELVATADWLEERAKIMRTLASLWPAGGPKSVSGERKQWMTDEAARFEGRAAVIRQTILKATQGA